MAAIIKSSKDQVFYVVHPLDDEPEEKIDVDNAGPMEMTRSTRFVLLALQIYLVIMLALLLYRVTVIAGILH